MRNTARLWWVVALLLLSLAAAVQWRESQRLQRGQAVYRGALLPAKIAGHDAALPASAARCINCHEASGADANARSFAPVLNAATLTQPQPRRGGPASRYNDTSLCKLLREGIDPAWVQIPRAMPRYEISDQDCADLWRYLAQR